MFLFFFHIEENTRVAQICASSMLHFDTASQEIIQCDLVTDSAELLFTK